MTKVSGVLDIVGSLAVFAGPVGPFVSAGCGFVNVILDLAGAGGASLQEQIGDMIKEQTNEIKNMIDAQTGELKEHVDTVLWKNEIDKLVRTLKGFQGDQRTKYIFMDTVLSGKSIPKSEVNAILTLHGPIADNSILYEAANFFLKQCRFVGRENKKKGTCDKFLFAYIGLASIRDITYTKLVSVLASANLHTAKRGVL